MKDYIPKVVAILIVFISVFLMINSSTTDYFIVGEKNNIDSLIQINNIESLLNSNYSIIYPISSLIYQQSQDINSARIITILVSAIALFIFYLWSSGALGPWWALLPLILLAFSPIFLSFSYYVRPEITRLISILLTTVAVTNITVSNKINWFNTFSLISAILIYPSAALIILTIALISFFFTKLNKLKGRSSKKKRRRLMTLGIATLIMVIATISIHFLFPVKDYGYFSVFEALKHYSLKESIPLLILVVFAALFAIKRIISSSKNAWAETQNYVGENIELFIAILIIILYFIPNPLSHADTPIGKIFPLLPLLYLLVSSSIKNTIKSNSWNFVFKITFLSLLITWHGVNTYLALPSYLAYSNETSVGYENMAYPVIANYDLGQDEKRFINFLETEEARNLGKIAIDPELINDNLPTNNYIPWKSSYGNPTESGSSWFVVSVSSLGEATRKLKKGEERNPEDEYRWLENIYAPDIMIGKTIFIYKL